MEVRMGWAVLVNDLEVQRLATLDKAESVAEEWELRGYDDVALMEIEF